MSTKAKFMKSPHALAEAALRAGCKLCVSYPITPTELVIEYWVENQPRFPGASSFIAECELDGGNYLYGAACTGARTLFASTGTGMDLISETVGAMIGSQLPVVLANFSRGGGLSISQEDYFKSVKAPGHGGGHCIVLAPYSAQEVYDLTLDAFDMAERYLNPVIILADYSLGLMMEKVEFKEPVYPPLPEKTWALTGHTNRPHRSSGAGGSVGGVTSGAAQAKLEESLEGLTAVERKGRLKDMKFQSIPTRAERFQVDDAEIVAVAFGTAARFVKTAVKMLREQGMKVGMFRPITLYPFPNKELHELARRARQVVVVECNHGQMVEDVRVAVNGAAPVHLYARTGGVAPTPSEIAREIVRTTERQEVAV